MPLSKYTTLKAVRLFKGTVKYTLLRANHFILHCDHFILSTNQTLAG
jgi:hypothetical protein